MGFQGPPMGQIPIGEAPGSSGVPGASGGVNGSQGLMGVLWPDRLDKLPRVKNDSQARGVMRFI